MLYHFCRAFVFQLNLSARVKYLKLTGILSDEIKRKRWLKYLFTHGYGLKNVRIDTRVLQPVLLPVGEEFE